MAGRRSIPQQSPKKNVRVMAVAENRFGAVMLREVLSKFPHCNVVGSLAGSEEALATAASTPVDVAVINQDLDGEPLKGLHLAKLLSSSFPSIKILIMVSGATRDVIGESFQSGARGLFHEGESLDALWDSISRVHEGQIYASQTDISYLIQALSEYPPLRLLSAQGKPMLTNREQLVTQYVTEGYTNREIAGKLGLSEHTVKNYLFRIFDRLGVSSRAEMIFYVLSRRPQLSEQEASPAESNGSSLSLCLKEAHQGSATAQYRLAMMYDSGEGVPQDAISAYTWSTVAERTASNLMESARAARNRLATRMSSIEIATARNRAIKWLSKNGQQAANPINPASSHPAPAIALEAQPGVSPPDEDILPLPIVATDDKRLLLSSAPEPILA
jgi:two-component system, NarL family, nitrate/nitrite response regulator NarL